MRMMTVLRSLSLPHPRPVALGQPWPAEARAPPMSDCQGEFVERDRHSPDSPAPQGPARGVASPEILDEALPGDDHPGAVVLLEATHRSQPRLQPTVVRLDSIVGVPVGSAPPGGSNSSSAIG
jgi:hypothetical protein